MRRLAHSANPHVRVIPGSAEDIETLITAPVDCITMLDVLEHVADDVAQVKRTRAVLAAGGTFVIVVPAYQFLYGVRDKNMGHYRRYSTRSLEALLTKNGFIIKSMRYWNALGVVPYAISEKVLQKPLQVRLREGEHSGLFSTLLHKVLHLWMRVFENKLSIGFGLSIICVAKKV